MNEQLKAFALEELKKLVRIPSVSFDGFDRNEVKKAGEAVADLLRKVGYKNVELKSIGDSHPYVLGEFIHDPKLPTILLYAHYDVQPPGRAELWRTKPFEPTEIKGRLYGRGTADDKAAVAIHAAALKYYVNSSVPANLKVIIEGEEECGSSHLLDFLSANKDRLKSDVIVVTDTGNIETGLPSLTRSLRGLVTMEVEVRSLKAPLHSGLWGGGVVDPASVLSKLLASLTDENGKILLKSCQGKVKSKKEDIPITREIFIHESGALKPNSVPQDFIEKIWYEPTFAINAIQASSRELASNIICDKAWARVGIRVTAAQKAKEVNAELTEWVKSRCPDTVELSLKADDYSDAWQMDPLNPKERWAYEAAEEALEKGYGKKPVYIGCGATIPFIGPFQEAFQSPVITFGVEDPQTLAHSENESLDLGDFYKAIDSEIEFLQIIAKKFTSRAR